MLILIMIRMDGQTRPRKASANQKRSRWARTDQRTNWNRLIQICHGPSPVTSRRHVIHGSMFGRKCHQHHQRRPTNPPIRTLEIQLDVNHWRNESHMISRNHIQIVHGKMLKQSELQFYSRDIQPVLFFSIQPWNKLTFLGKRPRDIPENGEMKKEGLADDHVTNGLKRRKQEERYHTHKQLERWNKKNQHIINPASGTVSYLWLVDGLSTIAQPIG